MPADQPREWKIVTCRNCGGVLPAEDEVAGVVWSCGECGFVDTACALFVVPALALTAERKRREEADVALANEIERADAAEGLIDYWNDPAAPGSPAHEIERLRARVEELEEALRAEALRAAADLDFARAAAVLSPEEGER